MSDPADPRGAPRIGNGLWVAWQHLLSQPRPQAFHPAGRDHGRRRHGGRLRVVPERPIAHRFGHRLGAELHGHEPGRPCQRDLLVAAVELNGVKATRQKDPPT
jgi:hypothetical protein